MADERKPPLRISKELKSGRPAQKLELARQKRLIAGTKGYRQLNILVNTNSPTPGHPWSKT